MVDVAAQTGMLSKDDIINLITVGVARHNARTLTRLRCRRKKVVAEGLACCSERTNRTMVHQ